MYKFLKKLLKLKICYGCDKIGWHKDRCRIAESPKDYESGGILVSICNKCMREYYDN